MAEQKVLAKTMEESGLGLAAIIAALQAIQEGAGEGEDEMRRAVIFEDIEEGISWSITEIAYDNNFIRLR